MPKSPSSSTLKALGALSGNVCAFPGCVAPIYDSFHERLTGQVCHIKADNEGGPRYDADQSDIERHGFHNLMFMCASHHIVIDDPAKLSEYTVGALLGMKHAHESRSHNTIMTEEMLERLVRKVLDLHSPAAPLPSLNLVIESFMVRPDNQLEIDTYDFRIKLRNDGPSTVKAYRIEVEIPWDHATSHSIYPAEVKDHTRGRVRVFRFTEQGHPGFTLYPGDTSDYLILLDYTVSFQQYRSIRTESIKVFLYLGDTLLSCRDYPLTNYLNEERLDQVLGM